MVWVKSSDTPASVKAWANRASMLNDMCIIALSIVDVAIVDVNVAVGKRGP